MEIQLTAEQEGMLSQMATHEGKAVGQLLAEYALLALRDRNHFLAQVNEGLAAAERGDFVDEGEMDVRVREMLAR